MTAKKTPKVTNAKLLSLLEVMAAELQEQGQQLRRLEAYHRPAGPHPSDAELLENIEGEAAPALSEEELRS